MKNCSQCGTTLADQAQFCMQCGTPVTAPQADAPDLESGAFVRPALIAGAVLGILSSIPVVQAGNCICCMWGVGGGGFGAWLLGKKQPGGAGALSYGDGAFVGVLSGIFGGLLAAVAGILQLLGRDADSVAEVEEMLLGMFPDIDPEMIDALLQFAEFSPISVVITLLVNIIMFPLFAMIGGILLVAIMGRKTDTQAAGPPEAGPTP